MCCDPLSKRSLDERQPGGTLLRLASSGAALPFRVTQCCEADMKADAASGTALIH